MKILGWGGGGVYERELVLDRQDGEKWNNVLVFFLILIVFCIWCLLTCYIILMFKLGFHYSFVCPFF